MGSSKWAARPEEALGLGPQAATCLPVLTGDTPRWSLRSCACRVELCFHCDQSAPNQHNNRTRSARREARLGAAPSESSRRPITGDHHGGSRHGRSRHGGTPEGPRPGGEKKASGQCPARGTPVTKRRKRRRVLPGGAQQRKLTAGASVRLSGKNSRGRGRWVRGQYAQIECGGAGPGSFFSKTEVEVFDKTWRVG